MYQILHIDLEVENKPWYGAVASPHCPDNYIVMAGWRLDTVADDGSITYGEIQGRYFSSRDESVASTWFQDVVGPDVQIITAFNAMFECKWFLTFYREHFEAFLRRGGRVLCPQMGHYLLSHQTEMYPALGEIAPQYGGTHKVGGVKILWEQGILTSDIDKDLLAEYLLGPSGDIENTALCFYGQMQKLVADGMWRMFLERCDGLVAYAYCEWFGLHVDMDVAMRNYENQTAEIKRLREGLQSLLPADTPDWLEFSFTSRFHLSALVYGGPVKGRRRVPYDPPQYEKADFYRQEDGRYVTPNTADQLVAEGAVLEVYKAGKNKGQPKVFRIDTGVEKLKWAEDSFQMPGLVNLSTLPEVVREKFLGKRADFKGAQLLCDGTTPVYSTSGDALQAIAQYAPAVSMMVRLATLEKDTSTYYLGVEYAPGEHARTPGVSSAVDEGQPREGAAVRQEEEHEAQVRAGVGAVVGHAGSLQPPVPDMREGDDHGVSLPAGDAGGAGPLSRDGGDSGRAVPHLQQGAGHDGRQRARADAFRKIPRVGVNGVTKVVGMLSFVGPDGIVHHSLNGTATVTGRLSSSRPNL